MANGRRVLALKGPATSGWPTTVVVNWPALMRTPP